MEHGEEIGESANPPAGQPDEGNQDTIKAVTVRGKSESLEKLQAGFDRLIDELSGINDHLGKQVSQHEALIEHIDQLPKLAEGFPAALESQKQLTEQLISQIKANILKDQQTISVIEKIPIEEAKQTDALINIDRQLAAATDVDVQMTETFNKFNQSLEKLNHTTREHSEGISQMSRTFAASDRYLKFIVSRQARQFMWVFYSALAVCIVVILVLVGIVIYLSR
jgi:chromosome segregation ATPase